MSEQIYVSIDNERIELTGIELENFLTEREQTHARFLEEIAVKAAEEAAKQQAFNDAVAAAVAAALAAQQEPVITEE
jgi:hypothetical protein